MLLLLYQKMQKHQLVPALPDFEWIGTNWAEIGHSMMKRHNKVWQL